MKLLIKQRIFSWGDSYDIYDEQSNVKYYVKAELFTFGHQLHVYDKYDKEIGVIREKLFQFLPCFEVEMNGVVVGTVQKQFSFFIPKYDVDYKGWHVEGDFFGWDYDVYDGCSSIIHITKELLNWGDTYVIDFDNPEDEMAGLMLVLAIDAANCSKNK